MANHKKSKKKVLIFSIGGAVLVILTLLVILGSKREVIYTVQTEKIQHRTLTQSVTATGKIQPEVQVTITPEVSGEITDLPVKEGTVVKRGDLLLKIKPDIYVAMRDNAAAGVSSAHASFLKAESDLKRAKGLFDKGLLSVSDLEQSNTSYEMAKAQNDQAEAALKQANESLGKTSIFSPMEGIVTGLQVERGDRVLGTSQFQGTTIMKVADLSKMEARVDVGENDVILITKGDTTKIDVDAFPDRKLIGIVYEIGNSAKTKGAGTQEEVTNFEVRIRIMDKDILLRPGMSMTATVETKTKANVLAVPIQSITVRSASKEMKDMAAASGGDDAGMNDQKIKPKTEKPKEVVFLVDNNTAKMTEVKRGISDDSYTEIVSGLSEGQEVVSGSYKTISRELENGVKVKIENMKKKAEGTDKK